MTVVSFTRDDVDAVQAGMLALRLVKEAAEGVDRGADLSDQQIRLDILSELLDRMRAEMRNVMELRHREDNLAAAEQATWD